MPKIKSDIKLVVILFVLGIFISFARVSSYSGISYATNVIFNALTVIPILLSVSFLAFNKKINKALGGVVVLFLLFIGVHLLSSILNSNVFSSARRVYQIISVASLVILISILFFKTTLINKWWSFSIFLGVLSCATLFAWLIFDRSMAYSGIFNNPNSLGVYSLVSMPFFMIARVLSGDKLVRFGWGTLIIITVILSFISGARASLLALIILAAVMMLWTFISESKIKHNLFLISVMLAPALILLSIVVDEGGVIYYAEVVSQLISDKGNILSGRDLLWISVVDLISVKPFLGWGPSALLENLTEQHTMSTHNLYLQITLQVGLVGILVFMAIIFKIWNVMYYGRGSRIVQISASFLVAVLFHQMFSISLTQNSLAFGFGMWFIVSVGIGVSLRTARLENA